MTYNAAERKDVRKAEKASKAAERERRLFVAGLMDSIAGRHWMHDLLYTCHIFSTSFSPEPITMAFREGERNIGLQLISDIMSCCPDQYVQMMREANERTAARDPSPADPADDGDYVNGSGSDDYDPHAGVEIDRG